MGLRIADDFLAKNSRVGRCGEMQQVVDIISKNALKSYLGNDLQKITIVFTYVVHNIHCNYTLFSVRIIIKCFCIGVTAQPTLISQNGDEYSLVLDSNPLVEFVEIPPEWSKVCYSQVHFRFEIHPAPFLLDSIANLKSFLGDLRCNSRCT